MRAFAGVRRRFLAAFEVLSGCFALAEAPVLPAEPVEPRLAGSGDRGDSPIACLYA